MSQYLFMCRSLTYAQKAESVLERAGISSAVIKAPQGLNTSGCGYAISIHKRFSEAKALLAEKKLISGKIYILSENGEYREIF